MSTTLAQLQTDTFQWFNLCLPGVEYANLKERAFRFLEESLELVQSLGVTEEEINKLIKYTYSRPLGSPAQEVGGVMLTLAVLCTIADLDLESCAVNELLKVSNPSVMQKIREKQASKRLIME